LFSDREKCEIDRYVGRFFGRLRRGKERDASLLLLWGNHRNGSDEIVDCSSTILPCREEHTRLLSVPGLSDNGLLLELLHILLMCVCAFFLSPPLRFSAS
jgi:hypothetical protein